LSASWRIAAPTKRCFNFCGLCPLSGGEPLGGFCARQGADCRSKWVRAAFSNCDQMQLSSFLGQFVCSLASPSARLASQISLYFGIKSKGRTKSKISFLSSRRRFGCEATRKMKILFPIFSFPPKAEYEASFYFFMTKGDLLKIKE
jgi:hypothetical protein